MFRISKSFKFSAAHQLAGLPPDHPCSRSHGHNYEVILHLASDQLNHVGFVKDYRELDEFKAWINDEWDHRDLNKLVHLQGVNPTAELIALAIYTHWKDHLTDLVAVEVKETDSTHALYVDDERVGW